MKKKVAKAKSREVTEDEAVGRLDIVALRVTERIAGRVEAETGIDGLTDTVMEAAEELIDWGIQGIGERRFKGIEKLVQSEPVRGKLMELLGVPTDANK